MLQILSSMNQNSNTTNQNTITYDLNIFNKKGDGYEFTQKGLAIAIHIICDKNFNSKYNRN